MVEVVELTLWITGPKIEKAENKASIKLKIVK